MLAKKQAEKFMRQLRLTQIWIYPIKSLGGISLSASEVFEKGLEHDRRWMLVDENGKFLTQRLHPEMALFKVTMDKGQFTIHYKGDSLTMIPNAPLTADLLNVQIWDDNLSAVEVSKGHSDWFSQRLGLSCKLVSFPEENTRPVDPRYNVNDEQVSLADGYPFLIIGQSSLDDLNARLDNPVTINRFRPNFVFTGGEPYEEDTWRDFKIGEVNFVGVKPCARCILTTIDPVTGEKGQEPLRTLSGYRRRDNKIYFGQNLVATDHTQVNTGDIISLKID